MPPAAAGGLITVTPFPGSARPRTEPPTRRNLRPCGTTAPTERAPGGAAALAEPRAAGPRRTELRAGEARPRAEPGPARCHRARRARTPCGDRYQLPVSRLPVGQARPVRRQAPTPVLLLVPPLDACLPQQLAVLLLRHPLAALLYDGAHWITLTRRSLASSGMLAQA